MKFLFSALLTALAFYRPSEAVPRGEPLQYESINNGMHLKIMPFGASITVGVDSSDLNGYREKLRNILQSNGNQVQFVGNMKGGSMTNHAFEAISGYTISNMNSVALKDNAYGFKPNIILVHLGTNDCSPSAMKSGDAADAPNQYAKLLKNMKDKLPHTLIIASGLIRNRDPTRDSCIVTLNKGIKQAAENARKGGQKVAYVDMYPVVPLKDIDELDKTHPHDDGYQLMAQQWAKVIAASAHLISSPDPSGKPPPA